MTSLSFLKELQYKEKYTFLQAQTAMNSDK